MNEEVENFLSEIKGYGQSKTQSIISLSNKLNISLLEAKRIVHFSRTWQERKDTDDAFQRNLQEVVDKSSLSNDENRQ